MTYPAEVVNVVLKIIGLNTINRVDMADPGTYDAVNALVEVDKSLQEKGYWFNVEYDYILNKDVNGNVLVPVTQLSVEFYDNSLIVQDNKVYSVVDHTFIFDDDIIAKRIVLLRSYENCPEVYRTALKAKAKLDLYIEEEGVSGVVAHLKEDYNTKEFTLRQRNLQIEQVNGLNTQAAMRLVSGMSRNPITSQFGGIAGGYQWRLNR